MEEKVKIRWYSIAFFICIFLLSTSIPFSLFIKNDIIVYWLNIILKFAFLGYAIYYIKKNKLHTPKFNKLSIKSLSFIPFLAICLSNFIVVWFNKVSLNQDISTNIILQDLLSCLLISISEELVFRVVLFNEFLDHKKPLPAIIYSSLIFGGVHLLNIASFGDILPCLIQCLYSFGIGLVLSFIYYHSKNVILPIVFHFLFNFLNDSLVINLYNLNWNLSFYLINILITVIMLGYALLLYYIFNKKEEN